MLWLFCFRDVILGYLGIPWDTLAQVRTIFQYCSRAAGEELSGGSWTWTVETSSGGTVTVRCQIALGSSEQCAWHLSGAIVQPAVDFFFHIFDAPWHVQNGWPQPQRLRSPTLPQSFGRPFESLIHGDPDAGANLSCDISDPRHLQAEWRGVLEVLLQLFGVSGISHHTVGHEFPCGMRDVLIVYHCFQRC